MSGTKAKVLIVDDHPIVRQGLAQLLNNQPDYQVCGEAPDALTARELVASAKPDLIVVDISLRGIDGIELIKEIRSRRSRVPILVFSMHDESLYAERALRAGAKGYVMKQEGGEKVLAALRRIRGGFIYLSDEMSSRLLAGAVAGADAPARSSIGRLSDRELQVFKMLGNGLGTRQIAEKLFLSVRTIETYRNDIKAKLGLRNATELVRHAVHWVETGENT